MGRTDASPVFVDTNVLVYASLARAPLNAAAKEALRRLGEQATPLWISRQVLREFLAVMTRTGELADQLPPEALLELVRYLEAHFLIAEDGAAVTAWLLELMGRFQVRGKQVHDANVVATMLAHGIPQILTHNVGDFARYSELVAVLPLA